MDRAEVAAVALENADQRVAEIAQEVPAVRDLLGLGRSLARSLGVGAGPIAGDHLDARMGLEPRRHGLGLPIVSGVTANWSGGDMRIWSPC